MGRYVVIDLEMCRVPKRFRKTYMHSMETIQIGAAVLDENFHIEKTYSRYVKPQVGMLDSTIARLTGIEGADLYNADSFDVVLRDFSNWLPYECIMISWSLTDLSQLQKEMLYKGVSDEKIESLFDTWVDAQVIFSEKIDNERSYSVEEALNLTAVSVIGSMHDGLSDAIFRRHLRDRCLAVCFWCNCL